MKNSCITEQQAMRPMGFYILLFLSGAAGLGYELAWTRLFAPGFGSEITAVLSVVAAFFIGLAVGAWIFDRPVQRTSRPARWYAMLECGTGCWALLLLFFIPQINQAAAHLTGIAPSPLRHWIVSFSIPLFLLLPATAAMGATLPAMEQLLAHLRFRSSSVAGLYAANTFGACIGVEVVTFLLLPQFGYRATQIICIILNFICASGMVIYDRFRPTQYHAPQHVDVAALPAGKLLLTLFFTGLLGIGYEVVFLRILSHVLENTIYSFAIVVCVYLMGTALGAAAYQKCAKSFSIHNLPSALFYATSVACCGGVGALFYAPTIYESARAIVGSGFLGTLFAEGMLAAAVFALPTFFMGALFSHLMKIACCTFGSAGRALAVNTLGAALSPVVFGVCGISLLGTRAALLIAATGYTFLAPGRKLMRTAAGLIVVGLVTTLWVAGGPPPFLMLPSGISVVEYREGVMASVAVVEDFARNRYLMVNNKFRMGGTATRFADQRQAHIPLLLHPNPKTALFLGLGIGATFAAAADHPSLIADGVEIIPEVIDVLPHFEKVNGALKNNRHLRIINSDARRYVRACPEKTYDVVIADLFHPARDGTGLMYSIEHFDAIRRLLTDDGIFCQWLPLYQLDAPTLQLIIRSFLHVFPHASAFIGTYSIDMPILALVGYQKNMHYPVDWMQMRTSNSDMLQQALSGVRLGSFFELFGCYVAGAEDLSRYAGCGDFNTDDRPLVMFSAPRIANTIHGSPACTLLLDILDKVKPHPRHCLAEPRDQHHADIANRLTAYWNARNLFLSTGASVQRDQNVRQLLSLIQKPLCTCISLSPEFAPAYDTLLTLAQKLSELDINEAHDLLLMLEEYNPYRREAATLRRRLYSGS